MLLSEAFECVSPRGLHCQFFLPTLAALHTPQLHSLDAVSVPKHDVVPECPQHVLVNHFQRGRCLSSHKLHLLVHLGLLDRVNVEKAAPHSSTHTVGDALVCVLVYLRQVTKYNTFTYVHIIHQFYTQYTFVYSHTYRYACTAIYTHVHTCTHMYTHVHTCTHMYV